MKSSKQTWTLALNIRLDLAWPKYAFVCVCLTQEQRMLRSVSDLVSLYYQASGAFTMHA